CPHSPDGFEPLSRRSVAAAGGARVGLGGAGVLDVRNSGLANAPGDDTVLAAAAEVVLHGGGVLDVTFFSGHNLRGLGLALAAGVGRRDGRRLRDRRAAGGAGEKLRALDLVGRAEISGRHEGGGQCEDGNKERFYDSIFHGLYRLSENCIRCFNSAYAGKETIPRADFAENKTILGVARRERRRAEGCGISFQSPIERSTWDIHRGRCGCGHPRSWDKEQAGLWITFLKDRGTFTRIRVERARLAFSRGGNGWSGEIGQGMARPHTGAARFTENGTPKNETDDLPMLRRNDPDAGKRALGKPQLVRSLLAHAGPGGDAGDRRQTHSAGVDGSVGGGESASARVATAGRLTAGSVVLAQNPLRHQFSFFIRPPSPPIPPHFRGVRPTLDPPSNPP